MRDRKDLASVTIRTIPVILAVLIVTFAIGAFVGDGPGCGTALAEDSKDCPPVPNTRMGRDCAKNCERAGQECEKTCGGDPGRARYVDCADCGRFRDACVCSCSSTTRRFLDGMLYRNDR